MHGSGRHCGSAQVRDEQIATFLSAVERAGCFQETKVMMYMAQNGRTIESQAQLSRVGSVDYSDPATTPHSVIFSMPDRAIPGPFNQNPNHKLFLQDFCS